MSRQRDREELMFIALVVGTLAFLKRRVEWGKGWMWPVPTMKAVNGVRYEAVISDGVGSPRPGGELHRGVDIMYRRHSPSDMPQYPKGTSDGTAAHFAPPRTPIVAAKDGTIWSAGNTPRGWTVVIDHGRPFASYYTHLELSAFPLHAGGRSTSTGKVTPVKAGDVIGYMGYDPMDPQKLRHLHFAVWEGGTDEHAVDPAPEMPLWSRPSWEWTPKTVNGG